MIFNIIRPQIINLLFISNFYEKICVRRFTHLFKHRPSYSTIRHFSDMWAGNHFALVTPKTFTPSPFSGSFYRSYSPSAAVEIVVIIHKYSIVMTLNSTSIVSSIHLHRASPVDEYKHLVLAVFAFHHYRTRTVWFKSFSKLFCGPEYLFPFTHTRVRYAMNHLSLVRPQNGQKHFFIDCFILIMMYFIRKKGIM